MDDQARALAEAWGLLSRDNNTSNANDHEAVTVATQFGAAVTGGSTASSSPSTAASGEAPARRAPSACNDGGGGGRVVGGRETSREDWAPLWEAMAMLSVPSVSVGAVGAGEFFLFSRGCVVLCPGAVLPEGRALVVGCNVLRFCYRKSALPTPIRVVLGVSYYLYAG